MRWLKALLRSPWFWLVFILVQFVHPRVPLAFTLWKSFGTQRDTLDVATLHGTRLQNGDLSVQAELARRIEWFGVHEERVARTIVLPADQLRVTQNRYRMEQQFRNAWTLRESGPDSSELPVVLGAFPAATEFESLHNGPLGTGWTSGWKEEGEYLVGYQMRLPLEQDGDRPLATIMRILLTPFALLADLLALPVIVGQLLLMLFALDSSRGH